MTVQSKRRRVSIPDPESHHPFLSLTDAQAATVIAIMTVVNIQEYDFQHYDFCVEKFVTESETKDRKDTSLHFEIEDNIQRING